MKHERGQRGFTLIEVVIAIVVVTFSMLAVVGLLSTSAVQSARSMTQIQASGLANAYLAEALALPFADVVAPVGKEANRAAYDNVADFNGDVYANAAITDKTAGAVAGYAGYSAAFAVSAIPIGPDAVPALQVTVTVLGPDGTTTVATGFRTNVP